MRHERWTRLMLGAVVVVVLAGCEPIEEPWVQGDRLEAERTRTHEQTQELKQRLRNYGGAYQ